jgi:predicted DNA-binding ribbon-helix-helix protein
MPRPKKRSLSIRGHRTSITLEDAFWQALHDLADEKQESVPMLIARIDDVRGKTTLSAAIRVYLLDHYRAAANLEFTPQKK